MAFESARETMRDTGLAGHWTRLRTWSGTFSARLSLQIAALFLTLLVLAFLIVRMDSVWASLLTGALGLAQAVWLHRLVHGGARQMERLARAIRHDDLSRDVSVSAGRQGFSGLQDALADALEHLRASRADREENHTLLRAMLDQAPVALIARHEDGHIDLVNARARRLFDRAARNDTPDREQRDGVLESLSRALGEIEPGTARVVKWPVAGGTWRVKLTASALATDTGLRKLVSVENIDTELDATELGAWHDLVRVLTHEMMNSLTPVSSLAETLTGLLDDMSARRGDQGADADDLQDIRDAVDTIGRRASGLLHFVQGYRRLTRVPAPSLQRFRVGEVLERLRQLMAADLATRAITLEIDVRPAHLSLNADPDLLEQALINLLRNATDALEARPADAEPGRITITGRLDDDGAVMLSVADNGPGVPGEMAEQVFVPFFTTKTSGSGVGLALVKQVMAAHGGMLTLESAGQSPAGAVFTLRFP